MTISFKVLAFVLREEKVCMKKNLLSKGVIHA